MLNNKKIKILILKNNYYKGIFKIYPINNGYGLTIGNSLRRILLSSLYGYSISYFKLKNIKHEFTYIKGIKEDLTEIILNLKQIKFKVKNKKIKKEIIKLKINNNKTKIYASIIEKFTKNFEVINKNLIIFQKDNKLKKINIYLIIDKGKGYEASEYKKNYKDYIKIDSIYSPIIKVSLNINKYYYNNNSLELLKIKILTNGSIKPINALIKSSKILNNIFNILQNNKNYFKKKNKNKKIKLYNDNILKIKKILNKKLKSENLSVRTINCLKKNKINKWKDLVILNKNYLLKIKNFGKKSLNELINKMKINKLKFNMNINKYN
ncbi:MAG: DNA-directed RNA polymerase subunit alpha [Candidatus Shikimatogenerans sp. JK-2022]|nr:DNA-directed RNA polymerase subunit alpha [Candidatus Shikimatogenerans bostrichidophilus]